MYIYIYILYIYIFIDLYIYLFICIYIYYCWNFQILQILRDLRSCFILQNEVKFHKTPNSTKTSY